MKKKTIIWNDNTVKYCFFVSLPQEIKRIKAKRKKERKNTTTVRKKKKKENLIRSLKLYHDVNLMSIYIYKIVLVNFLSFNNN